MGRLRFVFVLPWLDKLHVSDHVEGLVWGMVFAAFVVFPLVFLVMRPDEDWDGLGSGGKLGCLERFDPLSPPGRAATLWFFLWGGFAMITIVALVAIRGLFVHKI